MFNLTMFNNKGRYSRQLLFSPIGEDGQEKLKKARAAIIGCGGLGSVLANNLARAGIGFLRIVDKDRLEISNLQRQVLFDEKDVKRKLPKAVAAKLHLSHINSEVDVEALVEEVNPENIEKLIYDVDLVLDGTDNFETRFIINDACVKKKVPWIYGSVAASYGMVLNIVPGRRICLRCVFREVPPQEGTLTCNTVGIINSAVNVIASIQTTEALKILTGNIDFLARGLISVDLWNLSLEVLDIRKDSNFECPVCDSF